MDLNQTITELRAERDRLAIAIAQLETLAASSNGTALELRSRRGLAVPQDVQLCALGD